eukprot:14636103-Alexandrium_andersonii.AAC.1
MPIMMQRPSCNGRLRIQAVGLPGHGVRGGGRVWQELGSKVRRWSPGVWPVAGAPLMAKLPR